MSPRRCALLLATLTVVGCADRSVTSPEPSAGSTTPSLASTNGSRVFQEVVSFVLAPEECPSLTVPVRGTGIFHSVAHVSPRGPTGHFTFRFHDTYHGAAVGDDGTRYRFAYNNGYRDTGEPEAPFIVTVIDRFSLISLDGSRNIDVRLKVTFRVNPDDSIDVLKVVTRGDPPGCDAV
jgi:hypothetical protein